MAVVIRFYETGRPKVLRREEMEVPGPGPAQVKIKVEAIGLNRAEIVPVATTRTNRKREALLQAGAAHVIVTEEQDLVAEVCRITGNSRARLIFDPIAGPGVEKLAKAAAAGGTIIIYGGLSAQHTTFPGGLAMARGLALRGYTLFEITRNPAPLVRAKEFIYAGLATGTLRPVIDRSFRLEDIAEAHRYMEMSEQIGKIVITVP